MHQNTYRFLALLMLCICWIVPAKAQEIQESVIVYFDKESAVFDAAYRDNGIRVESFINKVRSYQKTTDFVLFKVEAIGTASPEGDPLFNEIISDRRKESVRRMLFDNLDFPAEIYESHFVSQDWENLIHEIEKDPKVSSKEKILEIIREGGPDILEKMMQVEYSRPYWYIYHNIFPNLRACRITAHIDLSGAIDPEVIEDFAYEPEDEFVTLAKDSVQTMKVVKVKGRKIAVGTDSSYGYAMDLAKQIKAKRHDRRWNIDRQIRLKTNVIGWGLSAMNIAVEIDVARNWSFSLPFYYSGTDYFKETLKFRTATLQPEVRYHFPGVKGLYAGVHAGVGWYNIALDGTYRIQDAGGKRPAWGGGLGLGYRMDFAKNPRWGMEFSLGAGVYDAKYDKFYNENNGPYAERGVRKTFVGIDNAAVTFTYSFDVRRKEGRK